MTVARQFEPFKYASIHITTDSPFTRIHTYHCSMHLLTVKIIPKTENTVVTPSIYGVESPVFLRIMLKTADRTTAEAK